ncbi:MAG: S41 family peptidase [Bacteroidota bacterium]
MKALFSLILLTALSYYQSNIYAQKSEQPSTLTKAEIIQDLNFLDQQLQERSSYQGLNGYDYKKDFEEYIAQLEEAQISKADFGLFLTKTVGKIGDRHSYVRKYDLPNKRFLPFIAAPFEGKVAALDYHRAAKHFNIRYPDYPYLKAINGLAIDTILNKICPEEILAPKAAYFVRAVQQLRNIEESFAILGKELSSVCSFTFTGEKGDTTLSLSLLERAKRLPRWNDRFAFFAKEGVELNNRETAQKYFQMEDEIAYIHIPDMVRPDEAPLFYETLHKFMSKTSSSKAMIIDVRGNGGGTRHLIMELSKYLVHPDSFHVVNVVQQRAKLPLSEDWKKDLHHRFAYAMEELDDRAQASLHQFLNTFQPIYQLPKDRFSKPYFMIFNGQKLREEKNYPYYDKPVYILANERSFSAASVLATTLKCLPNIQLAGITTDGSSGNSEKFYLPNSNLKIKISTMVSFQTDGLILDGYGTKPDIEIPRTLEQVLWKEDGQLERLKEMISRSNKAT